MKHLESSSRGGLRCGLRRWSLVLVLIGVAGTSPRVGAQPAPAKPAAEPAAKPGPKRSPAAAPRRAAPPPTREARARAAAPATRPAADPAPRRSRSWWHWSYTLDYGVTALVLGAAVGVEVAMEPVKRSFDPDDQRISKTHRPNTYPSAALALPVAVPLATFALMQLQSKSWHDFHHATLGLLEAYALTALFTDLIKNLAGRLRPDFLARCQPDADLRCTGDPDEVADGRRAFPSGHSSLAFTGAAFLSLYLWGRLAPFQGWSALWKIPTLLLPLVGSSLVAYSRLTDHRHHVEDVVAGSLLGTGFAVLGYFLHYHPPWSARAGQPRRRGRVIVTPVAGAGHVGLVATGEL